MTSCSYKSLAVMSIISVASIAITSGSWAQGTDSRTIKTLTIVTETNSISDVKNIVYDELGNNDSFTLVSPHPAKNPKKETQTWSGTFENVFYRGNFKMVSSK